jgi:hypothetical protein
MPNLVKPMPQKKVLEHRSGMRASEKELPEWHSGTFQHTTTPSYNGNYIEEATWFAN